MFDAFSAAAKMALCVGACLTFPTPNCERRALAHREAMWS